MSACADGFMVEVTGCRLPCDEFLAAALRLNFMHP